MFFKRRETQAEMEDFYNTNHRLIMYDEDTKSVEIHTVTGITDKNVIAAGYASVPIEDCSLYISEIGRVYTVQAPAKYIQETKRLAELEQSIVLSHLTNFKEPRPQNPNLDMFKWAMVFLLFVAIVVMAF